MSTLKATYLQQAASTNPNITLDGSANATVGGTLVMGSSFKRNRIINGDMRVDQRNAGASYAVTTTTAYGSCDRYFWLAGANSVFTAQQVSTGNTDFQNALRVQRTAASTSTVTVYYAQIIETVNCIDLAGQTVTWSFYATAGANFSAASSNLSYQLWTGTGTDQGSSSFNNGTWTSGAVTTSGNATVSTTRTRFTITATIPAGTKEIGLRWYWAGVGTAGANDYVDITGVQLEVGSVATPYERQIYSDQLIQCMRYYEIAQGAGWSRSADNIVVGSTPFTVQKRASPTVTYSKLSGGGTGTVTALFTATIYTAACYQSGAAGSADCLYQSIASAEL